jgi:cardiolipin synthase
MSFWTLFWIGYFLTWTVIPFVLLANKPPISTLTWIWAIILFPYLGPIAYALLGSDRLARKHLRQRQEIESTVRDERRDDHVTPRTRRALAELDPQEKSIAELLSCLNDHAISNAEEIDLLVDGAQFYPALFNRIREAKHHAHVEFFIIQRDKYGREMVELLADAAKRGVEVRVLADQFGNSRLDAAFFKPMTDAGGQFAFFKTGNPMRNRWNFNLRNHRKLQIFDGRIAFVGGMNLGREYKGEDPNYGSWRDVQLEMRGSVAAILQRCFADDWLFATGEKLTDERYYPKESESEACHLVQVIADGPDIPEDPIQMSIVALLNAAQERAWFTAGYFVPNEPLLTAMKISAARGVDVRILVSEKTDHPYLVQVGRSYYEELLEYGVRIFEYEKGINHAKVATIDDCWTMIGSANFDIRSMQLNFELNVLARHEAATTELNRVLADDYADSREIQLEDFRKRPFTQRFQESLFRPLAPLL